MLPLILRKNLGAQAAIWDNIIFHSRGFTGVVENRPYTEMLQMLTEYTGNLFYRGCPVFLYSTIRPNRKSTDDILREKYAVVQLKSNLWDTP